MESTKAEIQQLRSSLDALVNKQTTLHANVDELRVEIAAVQTSIVDEKRLHSSLLGYSC